MFIARSAIGAPGCDEAETQGRESIPDHAATLLPEFLYASISYYPYLTVAQEQRLHRHAGAIMWNRLPPAAKCSNRYLDFKSQALQYILSAT